MAAKATQAAPRLKALYVNTYRKELQTELSLKNSMQVPELEKIIVSVGTGSKKDDKRHLEMVRNTVTKITGQAPINRLAKKSIAGFKVRAKMGAPIGVMVTLRGARMYEFMDRLINIALPRVRDFHGTTAKFDKGGNYNIGITDQSIFPELNFADTQSVHGLQVTFVIKNGSVEYSRALLEKFGVPFEKKGDQ